MKKCVQLCTLVTQRGLKGRQLSQLCDITVYSTACEMSVQGGAFAMYINTDSELPTHTPWQILFMYIYD